MAISIDAGEILKSCRLPILDVRSPGEFASGHIPNANNVPLLDDAERAEVGTLYKQSGSEPAIARGRQLVGVKLEQLVDAVRAITAGPEVVVHCWRGGMRSVGFAGLLQEHGFQPKLVKGGYKAYRKSVHDCLAEPRRVVILCGHSGSGKTLLLQRLRESGEQVVDLESLAGHRGSVFGGIGLPAQPTVEQFENHLGQAWNRLDPSKPVWIEGESQSIGRVYIPAPCWKQMMEAPSISVEVPRDQRVKFLVEEYGDLPAEELADAIHKISKRLGGARLQAALAALDENDVATFASIALEYYDKAYANSQAKFSRDAVVSVPLTGDIQSADLSESIEALRKAAAQVLGTSL